MSQIFLDFVYTGSENDQICEVEICMENINIYSDCDVSICKTVLHVFILFVICVWIGTRICEYPKSHTNVLFCESYFSFVDHVMHICDQFESNFSPYSIEHQHLY